MNIEKDFGTYRSVLQHPGIRSWKRLCGMLDRCEGRWEAPFVRDVLVPYVKGALHAWPEDLRRYALHSWVERAMDGKEMMQLTFANAIHLVGHVLDPDDRRRAERLERLFGSRHLDNLRHVELDSKPIDEGTLVHLVGSPYVRELRALDIARTRLTPLALELMVQAESLAQLEVFDISGTALRNRGASVIAQHTMLGNMRELRMKHMQLTDRAVHTILTQWSLPKLEVLELGGNKFSDVAKHTLRTSPLGTRLHRLEV
ncbi:MAG: hypothetical protein AAGI01_07595 [Myxococcota bacterium]